MKVQLFYPKSVIGYGAHNGIYFPLTLINIASYVKFERPDIDIEIWDGELYPDNKTLIEKLDKDADVVGISCTSFNYPNVLELAKVAKNNGSRVVIGGLHASYFKKTILENRGFIDGLFYNKGEYAFLQYLDNEDKSKVPNFIWRDGKTIRENSLGKMLNIDELPPLDYSLLEVDKYSENHRKIYPDFPDKPLSVMTHEGCAKREKYGPCSFCSIKTRLYFNDVNKFWQQIQEAVNKYGFNIAKDWGDSLTEDKEFLKKIVESKPKSLDSLVFSVYNNLSTMDQETIDLLKRLNIKMLFAAVESANDEILKRMNKHATRDQMMQGVELMAKNKIPIFSSYVLGERGETIRSLEDSLEFAKQIREFADIRVSNGSPMAILPGSTNFELLAQKFPKLKEQDLFDLNDLKRLWVKHFCPDLPNYEILEEYADKIGELGNMPNRFGWDLKEP